MYINKQLTIKPNLILKNRVVVPPMASQTANEEGLPTEATINHYEKLASSKASLIMVEYTYIHNSGKSESNQLGIQSDLHIVELEKIAKVIHEKGAVSGIQLTHAGAKSDRTQTGGVLISPSGLKVPVKDNELETPEAATNDDIQLIKSAFVDAANRAYKAGFQIIELHSAHGYGLNQWLSPITNQRSDGYGGNMENRSRLLLEIIFLIKKFLPHITLSVRMPGMDHIEGGLIYNDTIFLAKELEKAGVAILNISSGIGGWRRPNSRNGEGYLVEDAAIIKSSVKIPVIGVGGITSAKYINESIELNRFSLAAVGRAILNDPGWGDKVGLL